MQKLTLDVCAEQKLKMYFLIYEKLFVDLLKYAAKFSVCYLY